MKSIRAFPFRPVPEPGSLTDFIEGTGTNGFIIEAVKTLYEVPNKPENPIEWLRLYFKREFAESEGYFEEEEEGEGSDAKVEAEQALKTELLELETKLLNAFEVEAQNKAIISKLENELKNARNMSTPKNLQFEDFRKYRNHQEDYHYRIRPHPSYQPSVSDMLLSEDGDTEFPRPLHSAMRPLNSGRRVSEDVEAYADYPELYFPKEEQRLKNFKKTGLKSATVIEEESGESSETGEGSLGGGGDETYGESNSEGGYEAHE